MKRKLLLTVGLFLGPALLLAGSALSAPGTTERVSLDSAGNEGNAEAGWPPDISADGRYVAFRSSASNLVPGDTNGEPDIFVHDRQTGETTRVSVDSAANEANGPSGAPAISADGRYVAFHSNASNLVPDDTNTCWLSEPGHCSDIFVHDRQTAATTRVSVDSAGVEGNNRSDWPSISGDGRYVAFRSYASNLVPGDTNDRSDVFVHDRQTGETTRVSVDSAGNQGNGFSGDWYTHAISADGRYVAFRSSASNLVPGDSSGASHIFVHDRQVGTTELVSVNSAGEPGDDSSDNPAISADGRYVAFDSRASNLAPGDTHLCPGDWGLYYNCDDIYVHDRQTGVTEWVSVSSAGVGGNLISERPAISADGRYVVFDSSSSNLVPNDTNASVDVFVRDRQTGATERVSLDGAGNQGDGGSFSAAVNADGRYAVFLSGASNLVADDTNDANDIFLNDRGLPPPTPTPTPTLTPAPTPTPAPDADGDGCADPEELAGAPAPKPGSTGPYDPNAWYDFYDVPVPANPDPSPNGSKDQAVTMDDVMAVVLYVGAYEGDSGAANGNGVAYDSVKSSCDIDADTVVDKEGLCYDRSPSAEPNPPWDAGPPSGAVTMDDVLAVLAQVGLSCIEPP